MKLHCFNCKHELDETEFTKFERNPALKDRNGKVIFCKKCCSQLVEEQGNTLEALQNVLRQIDVPYIEKLGVSALESYKKKREGTNVIIKKNVYDGSEEVSGKETNKIQTTIYTCYSSKIGLMPKKYYNYSCSDGIRIEELKEYGKEVETEETKAINSAEKALRKMFTDVIYEDKVRLAKAVKLKLEEVSLHKNNTNKRQIKFRLKNNIVTLIDAKILNKDDYKFLFEEQDNTDKNSKIIEVEQEVESRPVSFNVPTDLDVDALSDRWGYGYTIEQLYAFEKKYQLLKNNYPEKTALHTEALLTYIRYRVNEEMATAKGNVKDAKDWGDLASKQANNAKINITQLSKNDLTDGLDSFGSLVKAVETAVDIIEVLPKFKEKPQDKVDFTLLCYINYVRDLKGLPPAEYKDIYRFYEERKKEYESKLSNDLNLDDEEDEIDYEIDGDENE